MSVYVYAVLQILFYISIWKSSITIEAERKHFRKNIHTQYIYILSSNEGLLSLSLFSIWLCIYVFISLSLKMMMMMMDKYEIKNSLFASYIFFYYYNALKKWIRRGIEWMNERKKINFLSTPPLYSARSLYLITSLTHSE